MSEPIGIARTWLLGIGVAVLLCACASTGQKGEDTQRERAAKINVQLGVGYLRKGNLALAQAKLDRALEQAPRLAIAHWSYALLQMRLGESELAEKHFRKAISLDSQDSRARNNYGTFLCARGRIEEAERQFLEAIENPLYKQPASAYTNAGVCVLKIPDKKRAEQYFREALRKDPQYAPALVQMAQLAFDQQHYLQSRAFMQRYSEVGQHDAKTLWLSYRIEDQLHNGAAAKALAAQLKERFPHSKETAQLLILERDGS